MARSDRLCSLQTIVRVRAAQEAVVQMRLAQTELQRQDIKTRADQREEQLKREGRLWSSALSRTPADLALASGWSAALLESRVELAKLAERAKANQAEAAKVHQDWRDAQARSDLAQNLARRAAKRARSLAEEARLNDVADRFTHGGRRP